jgi:SAM-dependent methyltransferase
LLGILAVATAEQIRADFDRIATLDDGTGNNEHYHSFLLKQLPAPCGAVLEVGCGLGALARAVAKRAERVIAMDFSPAMIDRARHRSRDCTNIEYQLADIREWSARSSSFDCVIAVATLHHLDHTWFLQSAREWLRPGGRLLVHDLLRDEGWADRFRSGLALPVNAGLQFVRTGRLWMRRALRKAWDEHGRSDRYLSFSEASRIYPTTLPGASVRRHLLWRYSAVWTKPGVSG